MSKFNRKKELYSTFTENEIYTSFLFSSYIPFEQTVRDNPKKKYHCSPNSLISQITDPQKQSIDFNEFSEKYIESTHTPPDKIDALMKITKKQFQKYTNFFSAINNIPLIEEYKTIQIKEQTAALGSFETKNISLLSPPSLSKVLSDFQYESNFLSYSSLISCNGNAIFCVNKYKFYSIPLLIGTVPLFDQMVVAELPQITHTGDEIIYKSIIPFGKGVNIYSSKKKYQIKSIKNNPIIFKSKISAECENGFTKTPKLYQYVSDGIIYVEFCDSFFSIYLLTNGECVLSKKAFNPILPGDISLCETNGSSLLIYSRGKRKLFWYSLINGDLLKSSNSNDFLLCKKCSVFDSINKSHWTINCNEQNSCYYLARIFASSPENPYLIPRVCREIGNNEFLYNFGSSLFKKSFPNLYFHSLIIHNKLKIFLSKQISQNSKDYVIVFNEFTSSKLKNEYYFQLFSSTNINSYLHLNPRSARPESIKIIDFNKSEAMDPIFQLYVLRRAQFSSFLLFSINHNIEIHNNNNIITEIIHLLTLILMTNKYNMLCASSFDIYSNNAKNNKDELYSSLNFLKNYLDQVSNPDNYILNQHFRPEFVLSCYSILFTALTPMTKIIDITHSLLFLKSLIPKITKYITSNVFQEDFTINNAFVIKLIPELYAKVVKNAVSGGKFNEIEKTFKWLISPNILNENFIINYQIENKDKTKTFLTNIYLKWKPQLHKNASETIKEFDIVAFSVLLKHFLPPDSKIKLYEKYNFNELPIEIKNCLDLMLTCRNTFIQENRSENKSKTKQITIIEIKIYFLNSLLTHFDNCSDRKALISQFLRSNISLEAFLNTIKTQKQRKELIKNGFNELSNLFNKSKYNDVKGISKIIWQKISTIKTFDFITSLYPGQGEKKEVFNIMRLIELLVQNMDSSECCLDILCYRLAKSINSPSINSQIFNYLTQNNLTDKFFGIALLTVANCDEQKIENAFNGMFNMDNQEDINIIHKWLLLCNYTQYNQCPQSVLKLVFDFLLGAKNYRTKKLAQIILSNIKKSNQFTQKCIEIFLDGAISKIGSFESNLLWIDTKNDEVSFEITYLKQMINVLFQTNKLFLECFKNKFNYIIISENEEFICGYLSIILFYGKIVYFSRNIIKIDENENNEESLNAEDIKYTYKKILILFSRSMKNKSISSSLSLKLFNMYLDDKDFCSFIFPEMILKDYFMLIDSPHCENALFRSTYILMHLDEIKERTHTTGNHQFYQFKVEGQGDFIIFKKNKLFSKKIDIIINSKGEKYFHFGLIKESKENDCIYDIIKIHDEIFPPDLNNSIFSIDFFVDEISFNSKTFPKDSEIDTNCYYFILIKPNERTTIHFNSESGSEDHDIGNACKFIERKSFGSFQLPCKKQLLYIPKEKYEKYLSGFPDALPILSKKACLNSLDNLPKKNSLLMKSDDNIEVKENKVYIEDITEISNNLKIMILDSFLTKLVEINLFVTFLKVLSNDEEFFRKNISIAFRLFTLSILNNINFNEELYSSGKFPTPLNSYIWDNDFVSTTPFYLSNTEVVNIKENTNFICHIKGLSDQVFRDFFNICLNLGPELETMLYYHLKSLFSSISTHFPSKSYSIVNSTVKRLSFIFSFGFGKINSYDEKIGINDNESTIPTIIKHDNSIIYVKEMKNYDYQKIVKFFPIDENFMFSSPFEFLLLMKYFIGISKKEKSINFAKKVFLLAEEHNSPFLRFYLNEFFQAIVIKKPIHHRFLLNSFDSFEYYALILSCNKKLKYSSESGSILKQFIRIEKEFFSQKSFSIILSEFSESFLGENKIQRKIYTISESKELSLHETCISNNEESLIKGKNSIVNQKKPFSNPISSIRNLAITNNSSKIYFLTPIMDLSNFIYTGCSHELRISIMVKLITQKENYPYWLIFPYWATIHKKAFGVMNAVINIKTCRNDFINDINMLINEWTTDDTKQLIRELGINLSRRLLFKDLLNPLKNVSLNKKFSLNLVSTVSACLHQINVLYARGQNDLILSFVPNISDFLTDAVMNKMIKNKIETNEKNESIPRITIDRKNSSKKPIISQLSNQISCIPKKNLQCSPNPWHVKFVDEAAYDAGGPCRELLSESAFSIFSENSKLTIPARTAKEFFIPFSCDEDEKEDEFLTIGIILGIILRTGFIQNLPFAPFVWKYICNEKITLNDIYQIDNDLKNSVENCKKVIDWQGNVVEEPSETINAEFNIMNDNDVLRFRIFIIEKPLMLIKKGFFENVGNNVAKLLSSKVLSELLQGDEIVTVAEIKKVVSYHDCSEDDAFVKIFWKVVEAFNSEERSLLLRFVTTLTRIPRADLCPNFKFSIEAINSTTPNQTYISAATCFYKMNLPKYTSFDAAYEMISTAVKSCKTMEKV